MVTQQGGDSCLLQESLILLTSMNSSKDHRTCMILPAAPAHDIARHCDFSNAVHLSVFCITEALQEPKLGPMVQELSFI